METMVLLTSTEVADYMNVSRGTISARVSRGEMPKPDALTYKGRPMWKIETIDYLKSEINTRQQTF